MLTSNPLEVAALSGLVRVMTSSNHRLENAGLNALVELLFKMLGMGGEDSNGYLKDHFIKSVTENWRYF